MQLTLLSTHWCFFFICTSWLAEVFQADIFQAGFLNSAPAFSFVDEINISYEPHPSAVDQIYLDFSGPELGAQATGRVRCFQKQQRLKISV